jgi:hypothetical protein
MTYTLDPALDRARMSDRNCYYRDGRFANVYTVYVVPACQRRRFELLFPDAERVSRRQAVRLGWFRPREAKRDGEQWWGGFADETGEYPETVGQAIGVARESTLNLMEQAEWAREMDASVNH